MHQISFHNLSFKGDVLQVNREIIRSGARFQHRVSVCCGAWTSFGGGTPGLGRIIRNCQFPNTMPGRGGGSEITHSPTSFTCCCHKALLWNQVGKALMPLARSPRAEGTHSQRMGHHHLHEWVCSFLWELSEPTPEDGGLLSVEMWGFLNPPSPIPHDLGSCQLPAHWGGSWQWACPLPSCPVLVLRRLGLGPSGWGRRCGSQNHPFSGSVLPPPMHPYRECKQAYWPS